MSKLKFTGEKKIEIIEAFLSGTVAHSQLRAVYGMNPNTIYKWIPQHEVNGRAAFVKETKTLSYSREIKLQSVEAYLRGEGCLNEIAAKYNISDQRVLRRWIQRYNANEELTDYNPKRGIYMANTGRKTILEKRKEITEYCISHGKDYKGAAALYNVSYSQVY